MNILKNGKQEKHLLGFIDCIDDIEVAVVIVVVNKMRRDVHAVWFLNKIKMGVL